MNTNYPTHHQEIYSAYKSNPLKAFLFDGVICQQAISLHPLHLWPKNYNVITPQPTRKFIVISMPESL